MMRVTKMIQNNTSSYSSKYKSSKLNNILITIKYLLLNNFYNIIILPLSKLFRNYNWKINEKNLI